MAGIGYWLEIIKAGLTPAENGPFESRSDAKDVAYQHYLDQLANGADADEALLWDATMGEGYHAGANGFTYTITTRKS
jgi:hypothetical protein